MCWSCGRHYCINCRVYWVKAQFLSCKSALDVREYFADFPIMCNNNYNCAYCKCLWHSVTEYSVNKEFCSFASFDSACLYGNFAFLPIQEILQHSHPPSPVIIITNIFVEIKVFWMWLCVIVSVVLDVLIGYSEMPWTVWP